MKTDRTQTRRLAWVLLTVTSALLLVVGLSLVLSRSQALAQPAAEIAALRVEKKGNTGVAALGDTLTYTIEIEEPAVGVYHPTLWMTDTLPDEVTYIPGSLQHLGPLDSSAGFADGVITWTASAFGSGNLAVITFSVEISPETTATEIVNTVEVTGTGELITDSWPTTVLSGLPPTSQIRSPDRDVVITQKDPLTINGIAWDEGIAPPYLVDDLVLSIERVSDWSYYVRWTDAGPGTDYILQEATEPDFSDPTVYVVPAYLSRTYELIGKGQGQEGTYYYRVRASRPGLGPSRWSNVASVVVPWTAGSASPLVSALPADVATNGSVTVQVRIDDGDWHTAIVTATDWGGWEWSYEWLLPEENDVQHAIHARASHADGVFGPTDTITVTLHNKDYIMILPIIFSRWPPIPYAPTLYDIEEPDEDSYRVRWHYPYSDPPVSSYTLQEAKGTPTDFVDVYNGSGTSHDFSDKKNGTYYYRVRGHNWYGPGEWSDVKSVTVQVFEYFDDFSDYQSGWPRLWKKTRGALYQVRPYEHPDCPGPDCRYDEGGTGYIIARRSGGTPEARFGPGVAVPSEDYEIEVYARWWDAAYFSKYQIFFGSDSSFSNYYALEVRINIVGDSRKCEYAVVRHTTSSPSSSGIASIETTKYLQDWTYSSDMHCGLWSKSKGSKWDHWKIRREDDEIIVWVNGKRLGDWGDRTFGADRYFGVGCTLYEGFTPSKPQFDNWSVVLRP